MRSNHKLMLTAVGAFALGALAVQGLHAQMKLPAFAYAVEGVEQK
jgi:hypothetical protein